MGKLLRVPIFLIAAVGERGPGSKLVKEDTRAFARCNDEATKLGRLLHAAGYAARTESGRRLHGFLIRDS